MSNFSLRRHVAALCNQLGVLDHSLNRELLGAGLYPALFSRLLCQSARLEHSLRAAQLDDIPSETTPQERRLLFAFCSELWSGQADVLEIGPFIGGTTRAMALGMLANPARTRTVRLRTFDRFANYSSGDSLLEFLRPLVARGVLTSAAAAGVGDRVSFREIFDLVHRSHEYFSLIDAQEGVLPDQPGVAPDGVPFALPSSARYGAVLVDGCKSWFATKVFMREIATRLEPESYVAFQDYGWFTCFWIPAFVGVFREHFELVAHADNTYVFQLRKALDAAEINRRFPDAPESFGLAAMDKLMGLLRQEAAQRSDAHAMLMQGLQHAAVFAYLGDKDAARSMIDAMAADPLWRAHGGLIAQARKSPTYRPGGPVLL
jgi:hypothetical protein